MNTQALITKADGLDYFIATDLLVPEEDGDYIVKATVEQGEVTYSFVEGSGGGGGDKKTTIIEEQTFITDAWGTADLVSQPIDNIEKYEGEELSADIIYDGVKYTVPVFYAIDGGEHLTIGDWDTDNNWFDFTTTPVGIMVYPTDAQAFNEDQEQHTVEVSLIEPSLISITSNGLYDVSNYDKAEVDVDKPHVNLTIINNISETIGIFGYDDEGHQAEILPGTSETLECYGVTYYNEFHRILKFSLGSATTESVIISKVANPVDDQDTWHKFTAAGYPHMLFTEIDYTQLQDVTIYILTA